MCRIVGFWDFNYKEEYNIQTVVENMRETMTYGGPDDAGLYLDIENHLALAHRRLSVLDLSSAGHQPMIFEDLVITYNGEVYNFKEIKKELQQFGYVFQSNSDTEVVLKAFHKWGCEAVEKFRGMFAFAIWNKKEKKLILFRDRMGVKPLYWYYKDGLFMFSSELRAFRKHPKFKKDLSEKAISLFLQYGYINAPWSIFQHAYKLEPGHFLVVDKMGKIKKEKYWDVAEFFLEGKKEKNKWLAKKEEEIADELENLLTECFKLRLVSDVPLGMFLSGGIDSSLVSALLAKEGIKLKTFTIGFYDKDYNEAHFAKNVAQFLGTDHTELYCTQKEALEIIPKLSEIYDEPFGDPSAIPTYLVSKLAKSQVKVSLSADGGDEQFCGYVRYWMIADRIKKISKLPFKKHLYRFVNLLSPEIAFKIYNFLRPLVPEYQNFKDKYQKLRNVLEGKNPWDQYDLSMKIFLEDDVAKLGVQPFKENFLKINEYCLDYYSAFMLLDLKTYLPDNLLVKVDRATMSVSLEGREPFLDHKLLEWTSKLPSQLKYKNGISKYILKKVLYRYIPQKLVDRPKRGFGIPGYDWLKNDLKNLYSEYLNEKRIKSGGIFNYQEVKNLLTNYLQNKGINHKKLWLLFIFEQWREKWI